MAGMTEAVDLANAALHVLATNNRMDVYLVESLSDELWRAKETVP